jgi:membrane protease YdiL (CAAX protease family)
VLALVIGLISFPLLFFPNIHVMKPVGLVVVWFLFAVINSTCEEAYWRGFLLDETSHLPRAFGVIYSTVFFTAIHPLMLGVFSKINAYDPGSSHSVDSLLDHSRDHLLILFTALFENKKPAAAHPIALFIRPGQPVDLPFYEHHHYVRREHAP